MNGASKERVSTSEKKFLPESTTLPSKVVVSGNYDPAKTSVLPNVIQRILNADDAKERYGLGSELHRMFINFDKTSKKEVEVYAFPLSPAAGGTAAVFSLTFVTDATVGGKNKFRIGSYFLDEVITMNVAVGDDVDSQASALADAITAKGSLPFSASATLGVVTATAKTSSESGSAYNLTLNQKKGESDLAPGGTTVVIAEDTPGVGQSDLTPLWTFLSSETGKWYTHVITPYADSDALDGAELVCGNPNDKSGLYGEVVYKPFNSYTADTDGGAGALTTAIALGDARGETDACGCRFAAPSSPEIQFELSCYMVGGIAKQAQENAALAYTNLKYPELYGPIDDADDWTNTSANRDSAVNSGITPIAFFGEANDSPDAQLFDVSAFWHPTSSEANAPFKFIVNQRKVWNVANWIKTYQESDEIQDRPTVEDVSATDFDVNAIDTDVVKSDIQLGAEQWSTKAWIYTPDFTIINCKVTENSENSDLFDIYVPLILSGNLRQKISQVDVTRDLAAVSVVIGG
jgi:phage tail sheath gpL-like